MGNSIKYSLSSQSLSLKLGNFYLGTGDVGKGPTETTGFWSSYEPPLGGYSLYINKASNGPSIYTFGNSDLLTNFINQYYDQNFDAISQSVSYIRNQSDKSITNRNYNPIQTSGLTLCMDPSITYSYVDGDTSIYDVSLNNFSGSINNLTYYPNNLGVLKFTDGSTTSYIGGIGSSSSFSYIQNTGVFTISVWFKPESYTSGGFTILANRGELATTKGFFLNKSGGNLLFQITKNDSKNFVLNLILSNFFTDTSWVNITLVGDGTNCTVFKNGVQFGNSTAFSSFTTGNSTDLLYVGKIPGSSGVTETASIGMMTINNITIPSSIILENYDNNSSVYGFTEIADQIADSLATQSGDILILENI
jgi:hypothetical protein